MKKSNTSPKDQREEILQDNIWRLMFKLALPAILGMFLVGFNNFMDAVYVGWLVGEDAVGGIGLAFPLAMITAGLTSMIGIGSSSLLSRAIGSKDTETQKVIFGNLVMMCIIISILLSVVGYSFAEELIIFLGGKGQVMVEGTIYYEVLILGAFFRVFGVSSNMLIRAEGKLLQAMIFTGTSMLLNISLTPLFMMVFDMGTAGAALGTVVAMALYSVLNAYYFLSGRASFEINKTSYKLQTHLLPKILPVGVSAMLMQIMFFIQQVFVYRAVSFYGSNEDVNFMAACYRIVLLLIIPVFGFVQALNPVVGINYGAEDYKRVKESVKTFSLGGTSLLILIWLPIMLFPETVLRFQLPKGNFSEASIWYFRSFLSTLPLMPLIFIGITFFQSIGNGLIAGILIVSRQLVLFVPAVLVLPVYFGVAGVYYAPPCVDLIVITGVILTIAWAFRQLSDKESLEKVKPKVASVG